MVLDSVNTITSETQHQLHFIDNEHHFKLTKHTKHRNSTRHYITIQNS